MSSYLGFFFLLSKNCQQYITAFKNTGNVSVSLKLLVENISYFPSSCDQNLTCTSQVLSVSNLNRQKEMLEAVMLADVFEKHSLERTQCKLVVGERRAKLNFKLFGRGTVIMFCMH